MFKNPEIIRKIEDLFQGAAEENRDAFFEYEVYELLKIMGLNTPRYLFTETGEELKPKDLKSLGERLMIKVVSPDIIHKQKAGGVQIIRTDDPLYVQFILDKMRSRITDSEIGGFIISEFVPYKPVLGNEVMFGIKTDNRFGPVLTVSKGGDDAEFFARHYDPANLFLPEEEAPAVRESLSRLKISYKYEEQGHPEYSAALLETAVKLNNLALAFGETADNSSPWIIRELDINPFVIAEDCRFIAIDGYLQFGMQSSGKPGTVCPDDTGMETFFNPKGIAVIGVSSDPDKLSLGRDIAQLIHNMNRDDLYLVNARGGRLEMNGREYPLYPSLQDIPADVDLAVYSAPAGFALDFLSSLKETSVKGVIFISGIPGKMSWDEFSREMDQAVPAGIRLIGPNCMGVFQAPESDVPGLNTLFIEENRLELKSSDLSNTALLTQSGALAVTEIDKLQNYRLFRSIVSFGNTWDVKLTDLMAYFSRDPKTKVLALYMEGLSPGEGRVFFELAAGFEKPVIVYKSGKTEAGARAAASHTASMSGSYDVFSAACRQAGIILADKIEDHVDYVKAFSLLADKIPSQNRVAGVVNAGFESTVGADELNNLVQAPLSDKTREKLEGINAGGLVDTATPFLDITPMADDTMYAAYIETLLEDENVDSVFVSIVPHTATLKTIPETCRDEDGLAARLIALSRTYRKPLVVSVNGRKHYGDFIYLLEKNGIPVYESIRASMKSLDTFVNYFMEH